MKFKLIVDPTKDEEVVATVHAPSPLTAQLEALVLSQSRGDRLPAYHEDDITLLAFDDIECITVLEGKTFAIDREARQYRLKQRLYELESILPASFIRINKSTLANEAHLVRFTATFSGGVDAVFQCGHREYVSRRCFAEIKRRYENL